jgi:L-fuconolactonase
MQKQQIIDSHVHFWDCSRMNVPWVARTKFNNVLQLNDYLEALGEYNVVKRVYVEVNAATDSHQDEVEFVNDLIESQQVNAAVVSGNLASTDFKHYVESWYDKNNQIRGIRQCLHTGLPLKHCLSDQFIKNVQLLGQLDLHYEIVTNHLQEAIELVKQCPNTRFVLNHCGNITYLKKPDEDLSEWQNHIQSLSQFDNVVAAKISGIVNPGWTPSDLSRIVKYMIECFGWNRVMFGGDWPVCTFASNLQEWIKLVMWIVREESEENVNQLFYHVAKQVYRM